ncbi:hypothetical protein BGW41_007874 [Actinomortierella wolfii]|nr:hypothetical protein BGW41_007874 [Actinomortierella wolfii]
MVQSFNLQGIVQAFRVVANPRLMIPNLVVADIRNINFGELHKAGIKAVAFDKDNCLTRPYSNDLYPPFEEAWKECKQVYKDKIVIMSNSAGTPDDKDFKGGIERNEIAFVGDRALTDVVFGNTNGMFSILTRQVVTEQGDNPMAIRIRHMEHRLLDTFKRLGLGAAPHGLVPDPSKIVQ